MWLSHIIVDSTSCACQRSHSLSTHLRRHVEGPLEEHRKVLRDEKIVRHAGPREAQGHRTDLPPLRVHLVEGQVRGPFQVVPERVQPPRGRVDFGVGCEPRTGGPRCKYV